jgi:hypothetical protein
MHLNPQFYHGSSEFIHHRDLLNSPNLCDQQTIHPHHLIQHSSNCNENLNLKRKSPPDDIVIANNGNGRLKEINLMTSPSAKRIPSNTNPTFISPPIQPKLISPLLQMPLGPSYSTFSAPSPSQSSSLNHIAPSSSTTDLLNNSTPPITNNHNNQSLIKISKQPAPFNTCSSSSSSKYANNSNHCSLNTHQSPNNQYQPTVINQPIEGIQTHLNTPNLLSFSPNTNNKSNNNNQIKLEENLMRKMREKEKNFSGCN